MISEREFGMIIEGGPKFEIWIEDFDDDDDYDDGHLKVTSVQLITWVLKWRDCGHTGSSMNENAEARTITKNSRE